jgi:hypothetical protein
MVCVNDRMLRRPRDPADAGEDDCETAYYALQDANFNVLGLIDAGGELAERYEHTPYGQRTAFTSPCRL